MKEFAESEEVKQVVARAKLRHEEEIRVRKAVDKDKFFAWVQRSQGITEFPDQGTYTDEKRISFRQVGFPLKLNQACARIDFVFGVPGGYVFLEVDEDQHKAPGYENHTLSGDMKRMEDVMRAYKNGRNRLPVLWLRYNPDASKFCANPYAQAKPQFKDKIKRENLLIKHLKEIDLSKEEQESWKIEYAFYDAMVVDGKTVAETTTRPTYKEDIRDISTVPQRFAYNPRAADVPAEINDVDMVSGDDDDASCDSDDYEEEETATEISDVDMVSGTDDDAKEAGDSQGTDPALDVTGPFDSADF